MKLTKIKPLIMLMFLIIIFVGVIIVSQNQKESFGNKTKPKDENSKYPKYPFRSDEKYKITEISKTSEIPTKTTGERLFCYNFPTNKRCENKNEKFKKNIIDGSENFPTVDGKSKEFRSLNMFAFNDKKPSCCGQSQYFTSGGCYCITAKQKKYLNNNGVV
jgi:hypothetical protein